MSEQSQTIYEMPELSEDQVIVYILQRNYDKENIEEMKQRLAEGEVDHVMVEEGTSVIVANKDQVFMGEEGNIYLKEDEEIRELLGLEEF